MPYRRYTPARRAEAVALARAMGAEAAAEQLGMDHRAIRAWLAKAGDGPELAAPSGSWRQLMILALARTTALVASGKLSPVQVATIAGIAARNADRDPAPAASTSAWAAREPFLEWALDSPLWPADADTDAIVDAIHYLHGELIRAANAEPGQSRRRAILAWFSGRTEDTAGQPIDAPPDLLEWAQAITTALVTEHGDLVTWVAFDRAEDECQAAERRAGFEALTAAPSLPGDLAALVAAADAYLKETA